MRPSVTAAKLVARPSRHFIHPNLSFIIRATKVGIIGYGWAATAHIDAINGTDQGEVTAVYSSRPLEDAQLSATHGGSVRGFQDVSEMLAEAEKDLAEKQAIYAEASR